MRGSSLILGVIALGAVAPAVATADAPSDAPPQLDAVLETCQQSAAADERVTAFVGSMPARAGAVRMRMRFDLERRRPGKRRWRRVTGADGFGTWERSLPSRAGFIFHKRVVGLAVPARYRALISFAWERGDGTVTQRAQRHTPSCRQHDLRPDLRPDDTLTATLALQPGFALFTVGVHNAGRSSAGPFSVRLGSARIDVAPLAAGERRSLPLLAPACVAGSLVTVRVDEERRVEESHEDDNSVRAPCPLR